MFLSSFPLRRSAPILLLLLSCLSALGQTEESIRYAITQPANASLTLEGTLTLPDGATKPVPVVLLIAGSGPTDRDCNSATGLKSDAFKMLADSLAQQGVAVARYDKRGSGKNLFLAANVLKPQEHRFDFYVSDAIGFIRQLQADKRFSGVFVAGHSEGSLVGMLAARQTNANGFISLAGAGRNIADVMKEQGRRLGNPADVQADVDAALDSLKQGYPVHPRNPLLKSQLSPAAQPGLISWMKYDPATELSAYPKPVLIVQGRKDLQVSVADAERLKAANAAARLLLFDDMNHILKNVARTSQTDNFKTYNNPTLPLTPGLATAIAQFVKQ
ncbi:alpha/beta hydrolase family protein [Spirosoma sp. KUDC1026]|uniref:alpha/beta hydrolase family protein n=1 Tax=Spirosoma sp. KUDC1026 TaxID=2745947 RepID=UPI00159BB6A9|nr:alpha/beta fold hydrolase [Spirosoma sp. KUDC1026]QKZ13980.1 alpha/beta fold hydrolase [Spirosoma sp. KUDC1026]